MNSRNSELAAISKVLNKYVDGCQSGNTALLREAFHPQAMMFGSSAGQSIIAPIEGLFAYVDANDAPDKTGEPHACTISCIHYDGNAATAEVVQEWAYGNHYTNYFQLMKIDGQWLIVSKVYQAFAAEADVVEADSTSLFARG